MLMRFAAIESRLASQCDVEVKEGGSRLGMHAQGCLQAPANACFDGRFFAVQPDVEVTVTAP